VCWTRASEWSELGDCTGIEAAVYCKCKTDERPRCNRYLNIATADRFDFSPRMCLHSLAIERGKGEHRDETLEEEIIIWSRGSRILTCYEMVSCSSEVRGTIALIIYRPAVDWYYYYYYYYYYLLTAIGLMPGGSVTKIGRTYEEWTYIARKQNIQLTKKQHISLNFTVQYKCNSQNTRYNK
jgi:hypothetical protein